MSDLEETLLMHIKGIGLPIPEREYRFAHPRRFRADFCWPVQNLIVECEGGAYVQGRHTRGKGFEKDCEKYNIAAELGYTVLRYTKRMIDSAEAVNQIERVLRWRL